MADNGSCVPSIRSWKTSTKAIRCQLNQYSDQTTNWATGVSEFNSWKAQAMFVFSIRSRPALGNSYTVNIWSYVFRNKESSVQLATSLCILSMSRMHGVVPTFHGAVFIYAKEPSWCLPGLTLTWIYWMFCAQRNREADWWLAPSRSKLVWCFIFLELPKSCGKFPYLV